MTESKLANGRVENDVNEKKVNGHSPLEDVKFVVPQETDKHEKKETEKKESPPKVSFIKLFKYSSVWERLLIILGLLCGASGGICVPFIIILYGQFTTLLVDRHTPNGTITPSRALAWFGGGRTEVDGTLEDTQLAIKEDARAFGIGYSVIIAIQFTVLFLCVAVLNYTALTQIARVRRLFLKGVLRQDMAWYDTHGANNFASRVTEDLDKLQEGIGEKMGVFLFLVITFVSSVITAFLNGWKLTLVMLSCAPVIIVCNGIVSKLQSSLTALELESYGQAGSVAEEVITSIKTVAAFCGEKVEVERYTQLLSESRRTGIKRGLLSGVGGGIMWFIIYCCYALAFWYGVTLILESRENGSFEYTPAVLIIVFFGVLAGAFNMGQATPHLEAFAVARGAAASVFSVMERTPAIDSLSTAGKKPSVVNGTLKLTDVFFHYPSRPEVKVLQGITIEIKKGEMVALVGSSGCGKSTVMQLIQRLYDPERGEVLLDGENVKNLNVSWLRQQLGVVGQEPLLFATSIYENIRYGMEGATREDIENAAKMANAHDFITKLPDGYETKVGQRGAQMSGGQKQRIAIARALVRNPSVLLLDEATSALDAGNERKVQVALDKAAKGRTTLVVSHRLSSITTADRIIVIADGKVVEQGTSSELLAMKGHYFKLVQAQSSTKTENQTENSSTEEIDATDVSQLTRKKRYSVISNSSRSSGPRPSYVTPPVEDVPEKEEDLPSAPFLRILKLNAPEWFSIVVASLSTIMVGASVPLVSILFGELYGVMSQSDHEAVMSDTIFYSILLLVLGVATGITTFFQMHLFNYAGVQMTQRVRTMAFDAILKQEPAWFDEERNRVGALCARLSGDAAGIQGATGTRIGVLIQSFSVLLIGVSLAMYYSWKMTLVTLCAIPVVFAGVYFESVIMKSQNLLEKNSIENATKIAIEAISNIRAVASLGRESTFLERYDEELKAGERGMKLKARLRGFVFGLGQAAPFLGYALSLWYGAQLVADEGLPYKNVIKVSEAMIFGAWMLGQSLAFAPNFGQAKLSAARVFQLMDRVPTLKDGTISKPEGWKTDGSVSYSKVDFSYPTRPDAQILKNLNLEIKPGMNIALVGPSGCGKSTVMQLLQRLYDPTRGTVSLDNENVGTLVIDNLRSQLGLVSQEPILFDRTIAENIAYGDNRRKVPRADIMSAAVNANIHEFISALPLGYETRLGTGGTQLSGGQKQRIAIARALVRNPRILLLDEATSALDPASESIVQQALDSATDGRTTITIAHRQGAVARAHRICVIDQGKVHESGTHDELMALGGVYAKIHTQHF